MASRAGSPAAVPEAAGAQPAEPSPAGAGPRGAEKATGFPDGSAPRRRPGAPGARPAGVGTERPPEALRPRGVPCQLGELASLIPGSERRGDAEFSGVSADSRRIEPGDVFLAMPGGRLDGHAFAPEAVRRGAVALVVERFLPDPLPQLQVPSVIAAAGTVASACYGPLREGLLLAGVTGTNGKTTTCQLLAACLGESGRPAAQVGTTGVHLGRRLLASSVLTTPQAPDLQAVLAALALAGAPAAAVEISSHGLARRRVDGLVFDVAVFTNLTPEHLDFHGDMEAYYAAKRRLFEAGRCRRAVVCVDSEWGRRLAGEISVPVVTFGSTADADVLIEIEARGLDGLEVRLRLPEGETSINSPLIGAVNGANCAGAYLAAVAVGVAPARAAAAIAACPAPPGRFEIVSSRGDGLVVIDYAHTPDALAALLATTRSIVPGRVTFVLGARGGRYHAKRADMARVAAGADAVVFTADSPGDEDPASILDDLVAGIPPEHGDVDVEPDRRRAIERAISDLRPDGAVLVTGRGHEAVQHFGARAVILDDRVVARFALGARPPQGAQRPRPSRRDAVAPPPGAAAPPPSDSSGVAVVVPARDAEATIAAAISSALAQEPAPDEVIVVDDGSCDATAEVVAALAGPIRLLQQGPLGPSAARNAAVAAASSPWVAFLDADDEWLPGKIAAQLDAAASSPGCVLCATEWRRPARGSLTELSGLRPEPARTVSRHDLLVLNRFQTSTVLARREALCRVGGFDASLDGSEDWDCWMRVAALGKVLVVPRPLVLYRDNPDGVSKNLQRVYSTAIEAVGRQLSGAGTAGTAGSAAARPGWSGQQIAAWHHLRFAVAFALAGDRPAALGCLRDLARAGLVPAALPAGVRLLLPFLARRALRRAGGGRSGAGPGDRPAPVP